MNFRRAQRREDPEINLIPLIDLLLVILIFLMVTTTYSRFTELQVNLPTAGAEKPAEQPNEINIGVSAEGRYLLDGKVTAFASNTAFAQELRRIAQGRKEPLIVIYADAGASHQAVVNVLDAARMAGLAKVTFAAQSTGGSR